MRFAADSFATTALGVRAVITFRFPLACARGVPSHLAIPLSGALIASASAGAAYANNAACAFTARAPLGAVVTLNVTAWASAGAGDVLTVYDGPSPAYPVLGAWAGAQRPPANVTGSAQALHAVWTTDAAGVAGGWAARVDFVAPPVITGCAQGAGVSSSASLNASGAWLASAPGGGAHGAVGACAFLLTAPPASAVRLAFARFTTAGADFWRVYDGASAAAPLVLQASGATLPAGVTSSDRFLFVTFTAATPAAGVLAQASFFAASSCAPLAVAPASGRYR